MVAKMENNLSYNQLSLPWLRLLVGTIFIFMGLFATILFLSQGFSGLTFLIIVSFCVGIEITKILLCGDVGFYYSLKMPEKAMFSGLIVLCLFCLSLTAETYFLMSGNLTDSAKLETTTGTRSALQKQLEAKQAQLDKCPAGFVTKCQKPLNESIKSIEAEFNKAMTAESEQTAAIAARKFWDLLAKATGSSHDNLMLFVNFIRAFLGEIIGLYLCGQFATYQRLKSIQDGNYFHVSHPAQTEQPPAQTQPIQQQTPQAAQQLPRYNFSNLKW
jgi:hypothetical protein